MSRGERATGTPNAVYNLSSALFHALEASASYDQYIREAEGAGDEELANFFREVRDEDSVRAGEAQQLISERTPTTERTEGATMLREGVVAEPRPRTETSGILAGTEAALLRPEDL
jgi:hypothetical protein